MIDFHFFNLKLTFLFKKYLGDVYYDNCFPSYETPKFCYFAKNRKQPINNFEALLREPLVRLNKEFAMRKFLFFYTINI